MVAITEGCRS